MPKRATDWLARTGLTGRPVTRRRYGLDVDLGGGRHRVWRSVGPAHTHDGREIDTDLDTDTGGWRAKGRALDFGIRVGPSGKRRIMPRHNHAAEFIDLGRPQWQVRDVWTDVPFAKESRVGNRYEWTGDGYTLTLAVHPSGVRTTWTLDDALYARPTRWSVRLTGLDFVDGALVSQSDGTTVMWLGVPRWSDAIGQVGVIPYEWAGGFLTYRPSLPFAVAYPLRLDPDFGTAITTGADDGHIRLTYDTKNGLVPLFLTDFLSDLTGITYADADNWIKYHSFFGFTDITVPNGAAVSDAHLDLIFQDVSFECVVQTVISMIDVDDYTTPTSYDGGAPDWVTDHAAHTAATVNWNPDTTGHTAGDPLVSANFATCAEEVFARAGYASGNHIGIHVDGGIIPETAGTYAATIASYEHATYAEPSIDITYTEPGAQVSPAPVSAPGAAVPGVTVRGGGSTSPATVAAAAAVPAPTLRWGTKVSPATVSATVGIPAPTVQVVVRVSPGPVSATVAISATTVRAGSEITVVEIAATTTIPTPTVRGGGSTSPATVTALATIPGVTIQAGSKITVATVSAVAAVSAVTATGGASVSPPTVSAVATVPTPITGIVTAIVIAWAAYTRQTEGWVASARTAVTWDAGV